MKKKTLALAILPLALGITLTAAVSQPTMAKAEGDSSETSVLSSESEEPIEGENPSEEGETEQTKTEALLEKVTALEDKLDSIKNTEIYAIIMTALMGVYTVYATIDKLKQKGLLKESSAIVVKSDAILTKANEEIDKLKEEKEIIKEEYEALKTESSKLVSQVDELLKSLGEIEGNSGKAKELSQELEKALLVISQNETELVKSGAYKKIKAIFEGAKDEDIQG